jgi:hypothetical protein
VALQPASCSSVALHVQAPNCRPCLPPQRSGRGRSVARRRTASGRPRWPFSPTMCPPQRPERGPSTVAGSTADEPAARGRRGCRPGRSDFPACTRVSWLAPARGCDRRSTRRRGCGAARGNSTRSPVGECGQSRSAFTRHWNEGAPAWRFVSRCVPSGERCGLRGRGVRRAAPRRLKRRHRRNRPLPGPRPRPRRQAL